MSEDHALDKEAFRSGLWVGQDLQPHALQQRFHGVFHREQIGLPLALGRFHDSGNSPPCHPKTEVFAFVVFGTLLGLFPAGVSPSKLKHPQVGMLVVAIACNGLQTLENQTLPHGPKVCAQGVQHLTLASGRRSRSSTSSAYEALVSEFDT